MSSGIDRPPVTEQLRHRLSLDLEDSLDEFGREGVVPADTDHDAIAVLLRGEDGYLAWDIRRVKVGSVPDDTGMAAWISVALTSDHHLIEQMKEKFREMDDEPSETEQQDAEECAWEMHVMCNLEFWMDDIFEQLAPSSGT